MSRSLAELRKMLGAGHILLSQHALLRMVERNISEDMIRQAGASAELIEDCPNDKYGTSCLLLGYGADETPLHLQVSRLDKPRVKIITLYIPTSDEWINHRACAK